MPEGALGKDLSKKNYINYLIKRYGDWKQRELDRKGETFNWGSGKKSIIKRYKASGINHIPVCYFEELATYLKERIDKTILGKTRKVQGSRNYSEFEEHIKGIIE